MSAKEGPTWTKGEWAVSQEEGDVYIRVRAPFPDDWYVCRVSLGNGNVQANANLLSAAPTLAEELERCQDLLWGLINYFDEGHELSEINRQRERNSAALAKARGEK